MKKFEQLGKKITKEEMKKISGGDWCSNVTCCTSPDSTQCKEEWCEHPCGYMTYCYCNLPQK